MRVPLDFDHPLAKTWPGYELNCKGLAPACAKWNAEYRQHNPDYPGTPVCEGYCKEDPPAGPGYQLWETTTEGSPMSPVFATLDELAAWCEVNASTFGDYRASASKWKEMLLADFVHHTQGNITFA